MSYCPKDGKPCIDDLCHGGGCLRMHGAPMLFKCPGGCGALISDDDTMDCMCDDDYYPEDDHANR